MSKAWEGGSGAAWTKRRGNGPDWGCELVRVASGRKQRLMTSEGEQESPGRGKRGFPGTQDSTRHCFAVGEHALVGVSGGEPLRPELGVLGGGGRLGSRSGTHRKQAGQVRPGYERGIYG